MRALRRGLVALAIASSLATGPRSARGDDGPAPAAAPAAPATGPEAVAAFRVTAAGEIALATAAGTWEPLARLEGGTHEDEWQMAMLEDRMVARFPRRKEVAGEVLRVRAEVAPEARWALLEIALTHLLERRPGTWRLEVGVDESTKQEFVLGPLRYGNDLRSTVWTLSRSFGEKPRTIVAQVGGSWDLPEAKETAARAATLEKVAVSAARERRASRFNQLVVQSADVRIGDFCDVARAIGDASADRGDGDCRWGRLVFCSWS